MHNRKGWAIYGAVALLWAGGFGWLAVRKARVAAQQAHNTAQSATRGHELLRPAKPAERQAAIKLVTAQLEAFKRDDYAAAVQYQSPGLRANFGSVAKFRGLIRGGFPQFAHYGSVTFGPMRADSSGFYIIVPIMVRGTDGVTVKAVYALVHSKHGYRVDGVQGGARLAKPRRVPPSPPGTTRA